jgi:ATP citrate (pro-S)-lyase
LKNKGLLIDFSVAYVSRSGGMSNELNNIISRNSDGVYEGIAIGGDR